MTETLEQVEGTSTKDDGPVDHLFCLECVEAGHYETMCGIEADPDRAAAGNRCPGCVSWALNTIWPTYCKRGHYSTGIR